MGNSTTFDPQGGERLVCIQVGVMVKSDKDSEAEQVKTTLSKFVDNDIPKACKELNAEIGTCQSMGKELRLIVGRVVRNKVQVKDHLKIRTTADSTASVKERSNTAKRTECIILTNMEVVPDENDQLQPTKRFSVWLYPNPNADYGFIETRKAKPNKAIRTDTHRPVAIPTAA